MAEYYIATTGNDTTGDGSVGNPWLTFGKAYSEANSDDIVNVAAGVYGEADPDLSTGLKTVIFRGVYYGQDGRDRWNDDDETGESIIDFSGTERIVPGKITLDGFTILVNIYQTAVKGMSILNNVIKNMNTGMFLHLGPDASTTTTYIRRNLWRHIGWQAGATSHPIFTNDFVNVECIENDFIDSYYGVIIFGGVVGPTIRHYDSLIAFNKIDGTGQQAMGGLNVGATCVFRNNLFRDCSNNSSSKAAIRMYQGSYTILNNSFEGCRRAIISKSGNDFTDYSVVIKGNQFRNSVTCDIDHQNTGRLDCRENYFDSSTGPSGGATDPITGAVANGDGGEIVVATGDVRFDPWIGKF